MNGAAGLVKHVEVQQGHRQERPERLDERRRDPTQLPVQHEGLQRVPQRGVHPRQPLDVGVVLHLQVQPALEVAKASDDRADELPWDDRAMLGGDELEVEPVQFAQRVAEDVAAGHVVLVERPDGLEVFEVLGEQPRLFGETAEQVGGEQRPCRGVERHERSREMQIRGEEEIEHPAPQVELPVVRVDQPEGQIRPVVLKQRGRPPVGNQTGVWAGDHLVDLGQCGPDVGVLVTAQKVADVVEGDDLLYLSDGARKREHRTRVDEHGLVCVLHEVDVALEHVVGEQVADPPHAVGDLHRPVLGTRRQRGSHGE